MQLITYNRIYIVDTQFNNDQFQKLPYELHKFKFYPKKNFFSWAKSF